MCHDVRSSLREAQISPKEAEGCLCPEPFEMPVWWEANAPGGLSVTQGPTDPLTSNFGYI